MSALALIAPPRPMIAAALASLLALATPALADLAGSEWIPQAFESGRVGESDGVFVSFGGEGRLSGHAGCHRIAGRYEVAMASGGAETGEIGKGMAIAIETRASAEGVDDCSPKVEALGQTFLDMLVRAKSYARTRVDMVFYDVQGKPIAHLKQTDWD